MNSLVIINNCIFLLHIICTLVNLTTATGPGDSSCRYSGNFDPADKICDKDVVKVKSLPEECSSFVFDGIICKQDNTIVYKWMPEDLGFDFSKINCIMDFYVLEFATFNNCSDELLIGGITPLASSDPGVMTLNQFATAFEQSCIDKDKVYFEFLISPQPKPEEIPNFNHCQLSYNEYCLNADWHQKMCMDNQDVLYEKGKFAANYSNGFIARDIDLVDRNGHCKCDDKFITFTMILNGFNNGDGPMKCDAFQLY